MDAVIAGVGESPLGKTPQFTPLALQRMAAIKALDDAGLKITDVDGLISCPLRVQTWAMPSAVVAKGLGISPSYLSTMDMGGASGVAMLEQAAMAIASGQCETVLCVTGQNLLSFSANGAAVQKMADAGWAHPDYEAPMGPLIPSLYALIAQRHMHEYKTTPEQMAQVAVSIREHAHLNPLAQKRELKDGEHAFARARLCVGLRWCSGLCRDVQSSLARLEKQSRPNAWARIGSLTRLHWRHPKHDQHGRGAIGQECIRSSRLEAIGY